MKASFYNFYLPYEEGVFIVFNALSRKFVLVEESELESVKSMIENPNLADVEKIKQYVDAGFVVKDDIDEYDVVISMRNEEISESLYSITILTTYECNFRCWYCVQKHENISLSRGTIEKIKKHICNYIKSNSIKELELSWFGGEPLLNYDAIDEICDFCEKWCKNNGIEYHNTITTNGYLLNTNMLKVFQKYNFTNWQITIDGDEKEHNKVKNCFVGDDTAFKTTLTNLANVLEYLPNTQVLLRYNFSIESVNIDSMVEKLNAFIPMKYRNRVCINPQKVWQIDSHLVNLKNVRDLKKKLASCGYKIFVEYGPYYACYVEKKHYSSIMPNGNVVRCNNRSIDSVDGFITENGDLQWQNDEYKLKSECSSCKYFPICLGGCPNKRNDSDFKKNVCCNEEAQMQSIVDYCESVMCNSSYES